MCPISDFQCEQIMVLKLMNRVSRFSQQNPPNCFSKPGPVLGGYGRVGWQISWVGISLVIVLSHSLEDVYNVDIAILTIFMYTEKRFHGQPRLEYE